MYVRPSLAALTIVLSFPACAPAVKRTGYTTADLKPHEHCAAPAWRSELKPEEPARELGRIRVTDTGFSTHCSEPEVRTIVERDACGLGADTVQVVEERRPNALTSTCYRVDARLLAVAGQGPTLLATQPASDPRFAASNVQSRAQHDRRTIRAAIIASVAAGIAAGLTTGLVMSRH